MKKTKNPRALLVADQRAKGKANHNRLRYEQLKLEEKLKDANERILRIEAFLLRLPRFEP